ncbi:hypothetical protein FACS189459_0480 [Bacilli bacterium]|nr:hypothetical protein FACS189459_0480 [Bacilli bacterium]
MLFKNKKIEMAHSCMVQNIYEISKLEGIPYTFPQTEQIVLKESLANLKSRSVDFDTIIRLKRGYQMVLRIANNDDNYIVFNDILTINDIIGQYHYIDYGILRNTQPSIKYGEHTYNPPEENDSKRAEWKKYLTINKNTIDEIIEQLLYIIKEQCFNDGNKRTAILVTNIMLLKKNIGMLELDLDKIELFSETIFKYDHDIINLKEAIEIIKNNFIIANVHDRREKLSIINHNEQINEIEEALRTNNISKSQLAKMIGYDRSNINRILNFKLKPSVRIAKLISNILKIE